MKNYTKLSVLCSLSMLSIAANEEIEVFEPVETNFQDMLIAAPSYKKTTSQISKAQNKTDQAKADPVGASHAPNTARKQAILSQEKIEEWAGQNTDIVLQVKPGSKVVITSPENPLKAPLAASSKSEKYLAVNDENEPSSSFKNPSVKFNQGQENNSNSDQSNQSASPSNISYQEPTQMAPSYNAPARVNVKGKWDFWLSGSFIFWQPKMDNFLFALNVTPAPTQLNEFLPVHGNVVYMHSSYKPGFKAGLGMSFPSDNWSLGAEYTYLQGTNHQHLSVPIDKVLRSFWNNKVNGGDAVEESTSWSYFFNILDLSLSRAGYFGSRVVLTPYFGARLFINNQRVHAKTLFNINLFPNFTPFTVLSKTETTGWELGPRGGIQGNWLLGKWFQLLGDASVSILYGDFHSRQKEIGSTATGDATETAINVRDHNQIFCPNLDLSVGFAWNRYLNSQKQHLSLSAKYDFLFFWNNNQLSAQITRDLDFPRNNTIPALSFNGLTVTLALDF